MENTCLVTSGLKKSPGINNSYHSILDIEKYVCIASVSDARKLTEKVFEKNAGFISSHDYNGYKVSWSWFSEIFLFCNHYLEIRNLILAIEKLKVDAIHIDNIIPKYSRVIEIYFFNKKIIFTKKEKKNMSTYIFFFFNLFMLLYSSISIISLYLFNKERVGTYTGDFIYKDTKSDFRLNDLYRKYQQNNINYIEFF